jgi:hypothetical protein
MDIELGTFGLRVLRESFGARRKENFLRFLKDIFISE